MTCRQTLAAPGCAAAHDALVQAFVTWRLRQSASDLNWISREEADAARDALGALLSHAINCGFDPAKGADLIHWSARRVCTWGRSTGVSEMEIAVALGEFAEAGPSSLKGAA